MLKHITLLATLILSLCSHAFAYDYSHCVKYFKAASTPVDSSYAISLKVGTTQHHILYAKTPPKNVKILKADPFVGLYLLALPKTKQSYELLPLDKRTLNDKKLAIISANHAPSIGHITKRQNGFIDYAGFSNKTSQNGVLGNICYQIYGLGVGNNGFIEKKYIDRFLNQKSAYYGDLGIRFYSQKPIVSFIDPFFPNNPFQPQDEIVSINGTKVSNSGQIEWIMSNLKKDSQAKVLIKRSGKTMTLLVKVNQRYGGFLLRETFLERFGIALNDEMIIQSTNPAIAGRFSQLRVNDKILFINKNPIITQATDTTHKRFERLKMLLSQAAFNEEFDGKIQLLILRDGLEIFIKI
ncbi:PDZ domain-containing protein [Helicobacter cinaedi]|uniref:DUF7488 domain-containing protein n=1 Tax=Helicobacter cinaedi TaxID=213 RepID=UPI001F15E038|nr:PDZ domain-containing protein [Helicobacter cinaedi]BDB64311.1 PDZ domain-containing protein [Helicobacter cinaedi]